MSLATAGRSVGCSMSSVKPILPLLASHLNTRPTFGAKAFGASARGSDFTVKSAGLAGLSPAHACADAALISAAAAIPTLRRRFDISAHMAPTDAFRDPCALHSIAIAVRLKSPHFPGQPDSPYTVSRCGE